MNINIGVLGHVDSGKTSLCKALSTTASTACFDKNPQSQSRGITLDLGFSSFLLDRVEAIQNEGDTTITNETQITLVDCPGHASLIRTIIGGASIIDMIILVVDAVKGVQTQTAECIILAEIVCPDRPIIIALNKIDQFTLESRTKSIEKVTKKLMATMNKTTFSDRVTIVPVSAGCSSESGEVSQPLNIDNLRDVLRKLITVPDRSSNASFLFSVDHCFSIRGKGTIMTGTCLEGSAAVNDKIEIPAISQEKKIKSIQVFKKPVERISKGDRAGICVTQFDPHLLERGLVSTPGLLKHLYACVLKLTKVPYFKHPIASKSKFHVVIGHETVMARITLFMGELGSIFDISREYEYLQEYSEDVSASKTIFALLEFERPALVSTKAAIIGSKLDIDVNSSSCRIAFHGQSLLTSTDPKYTENLLPSLRIFKHKTKTGVVERIASEDTCVCRGIIKKETNIDKFVDLKVSLSTGEKGRILGSFGSSGKLKLQIADGFSDECKEKYKSSKKLSKRALEEADESDLVIVSLNFKKYMFSPSKGFIQ